MPLPFYDKINSIDVFSMGSGSNNQKFRRQLLLSLMEKYVNGAVIQWSRIQSAREESFNLTKESFNLKDTRVEMEPYTKEIVGTMDIEKIQEYFKKYTEVQEQHDKELEIIHTKKKVNMSLLFLDIHFYFICCDKVRNIFCKLKNLEKNPELDNLWNDLHIKLDPLHSARCELEHIHEKTKQKYSRDLGNLIDDKYTIGGKEFDISQESLKSVCNSYEQVFEILTK